MSELYTNLLHHRESSRKRALACSISLRTGLESRPLGTIIREMLLSAQGRHELCPWLDRVTRVSSMVGLHVCGLVNYRADGKEVPLPFLTSHSVPSFSRDSLDPCIPSQDTASDTGLSHSG